MKSAIRRGALSEEEATARMESRDKRMINLMNRTLRVTTDDEEQQLPRPVKGRKVKKQKLENNDDEVYSRSPNLEGHMVDETIGETIIDNIDILFAKNDYYPDNIIDTSCMVDDFKLSYSILMDALLSDGSNYPYVNVEDPGEVLKILCGDKVEKKRRNVNDFWVWFYSRDQMIYSRYSNCKQHSDLVGLEEGNHFFRSDLAALDFVHGQLKVINYHKS